MDQKTLMQRCKGELSDRRFAHVLGVKRAAQALARRYGADEEKAAMAALLHDLLREKSKEEILALAKQYGVEVGEFEQESPQVLHGPVAARMAQEDLGIEDAEILSAVENHTLAGPGMGKLDKILFLSDMIEETRDYPGVQGLRELAEEDLDRAYLAALKNSVEHLEQTGKTPARRTMEALRQAEKDEEGRKQSN